MSIIQEGKKIAMCSDHAGYELKCIIQGYLESQDVEYTDFGTHSTDSCDYPEFAHALGNAIEQGECKMGIAICGTGNGINMSLNHHAGIRGALCWQPEIAELARQHNDANVLVMPGRFIDEATAKKCVDTFLDTAFEGGRHQRRVDMITNIENGGK